MRPLSTIRTRNNNEARSLCRPDRTHTTPTRPFLTHETLTHPNQAAAVNTTTDAAVRVAINGFGRIGTSDARAIGKLDPDPPQRDMWTVLQ